MKIGLTGKRGFFLRMFSVTVQLSFLFAASSEMISSGKSLGETKSTSTGPAVKLNVAHNQVVMENGHIRVTLSVPDGNVLGISYDGFEPIDNVLEPHNKADDRGYCDVVWNEPNGKSKYERVQGTKFSVIAANEDEAEISFSKTWDSSMRGSSTPFSIDRRYILQRGSSGFYTYAIFERSEGFPAVEVGAIRTVFKLRKDRFHFMAVSDDMQRTMPTAEDVSTGQRLDYLEATLLTNPSNPKLQGEVDDKYQYSRENKDNKVHGWIGYHGNTSTGFWMITPSNEFRAAGPFKQELTSHTGPVTLNVFVSAHYAGGKELDMAFEEGETFKKVYGPLYIHLNAAVFYNGRHDPSLQWSDAVRKMTEETHKWPYSFPRSKDYLTSKQRGTVSGRLLIQDRYVRGGRFLYTDKAYVGLALHGEVGSWQRECKGYQFWTQPDERGYFTIKNVVPGVYNLYAYVPGFFGDYRHHETITITEGGFSDLSSSVLFKPPRNGPTIWEIGIPDRSAAEFYIPNPDITRENRLYNEKPKHKFRQYGLWERYTDLYPENDLVYTVGVSNYSKDWFYAQVTRKLKDGRFSPTTWQIVFDLPFVMRGNYTLQLGLASASYSNLVVRVNDPRTQPGHFSTGFIGKDNAIARHGIHGLYLQYSAELPSHLFVQGKNTIYLRQAKATGPFQGIMYDYIRLERPEPHSRT